MGILNPTLTTPERELGLGRRGPGGGDFDRGRGGGDGREDGAPDFYERLRRYRLGLVLGLASVLMVFIGFTSAYIVRQGVGSWDVASRTYATDWRALTLPMMLWFNTAILAASSVALEMARRQLAMQMAAASVLPIVGGYSRSRAPYLGITVVLGVGFLIGQALAWQQLAAQGIYISTNPSSSFFYLLTGTHGVHLAGGIMALLYAASTSLLRKPLETRRLVVEVTAWYWHFMGLLWIYILGLMQLAG